MAEVVALCHFDECAAQSSESLTAIHLLILGTEEYSLLNSCLDSYGSEKQTARLQIALA